MASDGDCGTATILSSIHALALHTEPGLNTPVLAEVLRGDVMQVVCEPLVPADDRQWQLVRFGGQTGWVSTRFLNNRGHWEVLASFPVGSGDGEIGTVEGHGSRPGGPPALSVGPDGLIYLLDAVNWRIHVIEGDAIIRTMPVPGVTELDRLKKGPPFDMLAARDGLYLAGTGVVKRMSYDGTLIKEVAFPKDTMEPGYMINRLWEREDGTVVLWIEGYHELDVEQMPETVTLPRGKGVTTDDAGIIAPNGHKVLMNPYTGNTVKIHTQVSGVTLLGFGSSSEIYFYDHFPAMVVKVAPDQAPEQEVAYQLPHTDAEHHRDVDIADDGTLYSLSVDGDQVIIYKHAP